MDKLKVGFPWDDGLIEMAKGALTGGQRRDDKGRFASGGGTGGSKAASGKSGGKSGGISGNKSKPLSKDDNAALDGVAKTLGMSRKQFSSKAGAALQKGVSKLIDDDAVNDAYGQAGAKGRTLDTVERHNKGKIPKQSYANDAEAILAGQIKKHGKDSFDLDSMDSISDVITESVDDALYSYSANPKGFKKDYKGTPEGNIVESLFEESGGYDKFDYIDNDR